jgi:hypothetical protein
VLCLSLEQGKVGTSESAMQFDVYSCRGTSSRKWECGGSGVGMHVDVGTFGSGRNEVRLSTNPLDSYLKCPSLDSWSGIYICNLTRSIRCLVASYSIQ